MKRRTKYRDKFFKDYSTIRVLDSHGNLQSRRVYTGTVYIFPGSSTRWAARKALGGILYLLLSGLGLLGCLFQADRLAKAFDIMCILWALLSCYGLKVLLGYVLLPYKIPEFEYGEMKQGVYWYLSLVMWHSSVLAVIHIAAFFMVDVMQPVYPLATVLSFAVSGTLLRIEKKTGYTKILGKNVESEKDANPDKEREGRSKNLWQRLNINTQRDGIPDFSETDRNVF